MLYPIERILREWSLYYNELEDDIDKEASENCVKISFSKEDIRLLRKSDLNQLLVNVEKFLATKVKKSGRSMVFYLWVDGMIPAIKFSLVSRHIQVRSATRCKFSLKASRGVNHPKDFLGVVL